MRLFLFAFGLLLLSPIAGHAQVGPAMLIPATDYPAHSHITAIPAVTDGDYDCRWAIDCQSTAALFHTNVSATWHRESGWMQAAGYHVGKTEIAWMVTASACDAPDVTQAQPWSQQLTLDFNGQLERNGFVPAKVHPHILPPDVVPAPTIYSWRQPVIQGWAGFGLSTWIGDTDYEAVGIAKGARSYKQMRDYLIAQFRDALLVPRKSTGQ